MDWTAISLLIDVSLPWHYVLPGITTRIVIMVITRNNRNNYNKPSNISNKNNNSNDKNKSSNDTNEQ